MLYIMGIGIAFFLGSERQWRCFRIEFSGAMSIVLCQISWIWRKICSFLNCGVAAVAESWKGKDDILKGVPHTLTYRDPPSISNIINFGDQ